MVVAFLANLLAAFVAILALAPMFIGIIHDAREIGAREIADDTRSEWHIYILGCGLTAYYSWVFLFMLSHYL